MENKLTFEQAMQRLEDITEKIQANQCTLDESIALFEEGLKLSKLCKEKLDGFEAKLNKLTADNNNSFDDQDESYPF